ncbi:MAG: 16S rRNA (cytosine(1402)-N(4))-methyltransferase [Elusimicrobia bacterium CG1_02_63_36]|nr:MAG: 16S rRNA (cytosine(1402)-N(4))-methyltransferase [Elusimicrobia bacterium CG1_02_63_36]PIP84726.1 MAG: 16S rRNA (cytosine(1402)-N(4))-methyltransferase [Elusimicrobia bacterium CG22_combo_CG10-13_8_21_14_all_63_91]PJA16643.1 MAG: 16S rRNA (cytosine(1402)-N(4))-methyltransferase [Elusimicrobia bacterium CG_4_10_14_0_2_um_filter_63_34]PJB26434.1 MAG: 16S rRNA (cytosine(1402)-N(4))-methyltransferase [Elusimicrobia bacterium CG_4_9_14_3_um_filter_62_55]
MEEHYTHDSVLLREVVDLLVTDRDGVYLDGTVGLGGHAEAILQTLSAQGKLLGTDMDPEALERSTERLMPFAGRSRLVRANFRNLGQVLDAEGVSLLSGALFDLGVSSLQLDKASRGFALRLEGPLDMRLDPASKLTAARICNEWPAEQIELLLREYGEERAAKRIARLIVDCRKQTPFASTLQLAELIEKRLPRQGKIHPATKTFMALRIAVNQELENLTRGIESVVARIAPGGRIAVISFHSLEDRIVKNLFRSLAEHGDVRPITASPVSPGEDELGRNPRARSSKLRVVERTA